tara:strand:- start:1604 stop:2638 length:1035 start_codon:yes stop_codon:yes gene_type:complete
MSVEALKPTLRRNWLSQTDKVWLSIVGIIITIFVLSPQQGQDTLLFTGGSLWGILPFLLASIGVAAYAQASGADALIAQAFRGRTTEMIVLAAVFGAVSPFCSCGVIPLIAALLAMGVPLAPVMAFWLASPNMDPSMFVLTVGVLGLPFAIGKTFAAIGIGMLGGFGIYALQKGRLFQKPLRDGIGDGGCGGATVRNPDEIEWRFWREQSRRHLFAKDARKNLLFLGKWLTLAFVLESLMLAYIPADLVAAFVGEGGWLPVLSATIVGVPAYLNGFAALPLVGGLMSQGMAPGAAMAFLLAGGVTSIPAAIAVFALARIPVFLSYLVFAFTGALLGGLLYGAIA